MKYFPIVFLLLFASTNLPAQPSSELNTKGDNSPAVIARNFSATYGVRADAIEAILWIYEAEGYDSLRRVRATRQILEDYSNAPEKKEKGDALSANTKKNLGISNNPKITDALEWDLFAQKYYLSTIGRNSPAVVAKGDVNIWYGIPSKTLRALAERLEENKTDLTEFGAKLADQAKKYKELKEELDTYKTKEEIYVQAEILLEEGKLEEADKLIGSDYHNSRKRQAFKGYIYGKTKELLLQYDSAAIGYEDAVYLDKTILKYQMAFAYNNLTIAKYDMAIKHFEIALELDTLSENNGTLLNNLGEAWRQKGNFDKAIEYYHKALKIDLASFGYNHPKVAATRYNNLGSAWESKGNYDKAIELYQKALEIDKVTFGENHPNVAREYNNLGTAWQSKGQFDKAIKYFEKALNIFTNTFGDNHPNVATSNNNLGSAWKSKGDYDKAINLYQKALKIDLATLGHNHPNVATRYNNLGTAWKSKGDYDKAIELYQKALKIDLATLGHNHPNVATRYNNLGTAWESKGNYDKAIECFEKCQTILEQFFDVKHPYRRVTAESMSRAAHSRGMELFQEQKYEEALVYFQKALENAVAIEDIPFSLTCLSNIGSMQKLLERYEAGLESLEKGLEGAAEYNQLIDQYVKENLTTEQLKDPEIQAEINQAKQPALIRRMKYHKVGCLQGLKRKEEAKALAEELWKECNEAEDTRNLEDLKEMGYDFGGR